MIEFGNRLRALRKEKHLTQKQLAALIGIQHSVISFYEIGERAPSVEAIIKLASALNVSTDYLLGREKGDTMDLSGLTEEDIMLIRTLADTLRSKNSQIF